ncbi:MAG: hypothetical protein P0Y62_15480 [Candidatus Chryseobacterium colombiense]|nr:hypothetical protein [Chryseobacterium sp.]WEK69238.1 MAG: hypothetical protein P0Y62_15480 [Chryseobacterium sp.]
MKKIVLFFLLFFISKTYSQQKLNWAEVLYGDIKNLRENKIRILKLKNGDKVLRSVTMISENSIVVKDSLAEVYFEFDNENRLICVKSIKEKTQQKFGLNLKNNFVNGISKLIDEKGVEIYNQLSKVYFNNISYEEKETYSFDKEKKDSLNVFRTKYFFNKQNPKLSYKETYNNGKIFGKNYFNDTEVWKEKFSNYYVVDSILRKDSKSIKYHFENYLDHQVIRIENDSILTINKKAGKKVHEKLEYAGLPFKEVFYDDNGKIKDQIIYQNYQNPFNEWILWEERKYDGKGKLISKKLPNKKEYKLKKGILVFRKNVSRVRECGLTCSVKRIYAFNYLESYSPSILFTLKLNRNFTDNFDIYGIEEDGDLIYVMLDFNVNGMAEVKSDYSASIDTKKEFVRISKSIARNGRLLKYFKDLEVEAETITSKKYIINLSENLNFLSFPIHTFLIKEEN